VFRESLRLSLPNTRLKPFGEESMAGKVDARGGLAIIGYGVCCKGCGGGRENAACVMATSSEGNPVIALNAATSSRKSLFSSISFCRSAKDTAYACRNRLTSTCVINKDHRRAYLQLLYIHFFAISMSSLRNSIQLLSSLPYQCLFFSHITDAAGSFLGFGPRFFGPFGAGKACSFTASIEYILFPSVTGPENWGDDPGFVTFEAGSGQSFPP
jgi:hypothetical protein